MRIFGMEIRKTSPIQRSYQKRRALSPYEYYYELNVVVKTTATTKLIGNDGDKRLFHIIAFYLEHHFVFQ